MCRCEWEVIRKKRDRSHAKTEGKAVFAGVLIGGRAREARLAPLGLALSTRDGLLFYMVLLTRSAWSARIEISSVTGNCGGLPGRAPHGARGLKYTPKGDKIVYVLGRAPHGARGLKCGTMCSVPQKGGTRSAWSARIEIDRQPSVVRHFWRRAPHGARGLKFKLLRR